MNEELAAAVAEADSWVMPPLLFKALRGLVEERIASELPLKDLLAFQRRGVNVRVDEFLPENMVALLRGMEVIGTLRFDKGNVEFVKFNKD